MENTIQPGEQHASNAESLSTEARLRALERRLAEHSKYLAEKGLVDRADLSAELRRHQDRLRDSEKAMVERIGDVDDDLRAMASRLQRAWQTHRQEVDLRLRRHAWLSRGLALLAVLSVGALVLVAYQLHQLQSEASQMTMELSELRREYAALTAERAGSAQVRHQLERISTQAAEITAGLARSVRETEPTTDLDTVSAEVSAGAEDSRNPSAADGRDRAEVKTPRADPVQPPSDAISGTVTTEERSVREAKPAADPDTVPVEMPVGAGNIRNPSEADREDRPEVKTPRVDPVQSPKDTASGAVTSLTGTADRGLYRLPAKGSYALQLVGYFESKSLDEFVAWEGLPVRVYGLRETYRKRPWYAVIHSLHPSFTAAVEALSRLSTHLMALDPWIRALPGGTELRVIETGPGRLSAPKTLP